MHELDWDCNDQVHQFSSLNIIHWYPGSFISSLPGNIIEIFSNENDIVWDPFCGSGSSAIESFKKNRSFIGNDINHISILTTLSKIKIIEHYSIFTETSKKLIDFLEVKKAELQFGYLNNVKKNHTSYPIDEIKCWYSEKVMNELIYLREMIDLFSLPQEIEIIYQTIFLNIAKIANAQQKTWGHIADNVKPTETQILEKKHDVFSKYIQRLLQIEKKAKRIYSFSDQCKYAVEIGDSRHYTPPQKADLVITSPPYPLMNDYVTAQRLSYYWLKHSKEDINTVKKNEIGARYRRHNKTRLIDYKKDIDKAFDNIINNTNSNGIIAIVMPEYLKEDIRYEVIADFYNNLTNKIEKLYEIKRNVDLSNRWAPFKKLKSEVLTVWCKNE